MSPPPTLEHEEVLAHKNPHLPLEERVAALLSIMTLEEKVAQMLCIWNQKNAVLLDDQGKVDFEKFRASYPHGVGQIARLSDTNGGLKPADMARMANELQRFFVEQTRLGIPVIFHEECLHGLAGPEATSYPQPIGLASTFDPPLVEAIYTSIAEDARSRGAHQALTPVLDIAREPRWGRVEETFGEDPYLVSRMGVAAVRGFQGDATFADKRRVIATLKHFAAHGQPEGGMNCAPVHVGERELRDAFLFPFREVLRKARPLSVMASYNEIDGVPSHASTWLLRDLLRREWGFDGFVVSDYYAVRELHRRDEAVSHGVARDTADAARLAAQAGVNIELPDPDCYPKLLDLVRNGGLAEDVIDELVAEMLRAKFRLGLFEDPYVTVDATFHDRKLVTDRDLALRAALETMVLLKNDRGVLPLSLAPGSTIAVIGPNADRVMLGGYSGKPGVYVSVLQGIREMAGDRYRVLYSEGCKITVGGSWNDDPVTLSDPADDRAGIAQAVATAGQADVIILAIGGNEQTSREGWSKTHLGDRPSLDLVGMQRELVSAMVRTGKPVVVLLFNGRPKSIPEIHAQVPAILECWYLGQETGRAIAEVLFGARNPSGKLPISFPRSAGHVPCYYDYKPSARRGYLFDDAKPLYPFGFGLSYTTFRIGAPRLERTTIRPGESTRVAVDVQNTGGRAGEEVVQLYVRDPVASVTRPVKQLRGFARVRLEPGESSTVTLSVGPDELAFTNIDMKLVVEPGDFEIMVGSSSRDQDLLMAVLSVVPA